MHRLTVTGEVKPAEAFNKVGDREARDGRNARISPEDALVSYRFVVLQAAAGYGKTRLLKSMIRDHDGILIDGSQDLAVSLAHALGPLADNNCDIGSLVDAARDYLGKPLTLGVDNAHVLPSQDLKRLVEAFVSDTVEGAHLDRLVLASRQPLDSQLGHHLAVGSGFVVTARSMKISEHDRNAVSEQSSRALLDDSFTRALGATGGWPIHTLTVLRGNNPDDPRAVADAMRSLVAYVEDQVFGALSKECQEFVLYSAPTGVLDPAGCERQFGVERTREHIHECVSLGLAEYDTSECAQEDAGVWLPALVEAAIKISLAMPSGEGTQRLAQSALRIRDVAPRAAFKLAARLGDGALAYRILVETWLERLIVDDGYAVLKDAEWLAQQYPQSHELLIIQACALDTQGDAIGAKLKARRATQAPRDNAGNPLNSLKIELYSPLFIEDSEIKLGAAATLAFEYLSGPETNQDIQACEVFVVGWTECRLRRNPRRALELLDSAALQAASEGDEELARMANANALFVRAFIGRFSDVQEMHDSLQRLPNCENAWSRYDAGITHTAIGMKHYWTNSLALGLEHLEEVDQEDKQWEGYRGLAVVYRALTAAAIGERSALARAQILLTQFPQSERHGVPWGTYRSLGLAAVAERLGKPELALKHLQLLRSGAFVPVTHALGAEMYRRLGQPEEAQEMIQGIAQHPMPNYARIQSLVTSAAICWSDGDRGQAYTVLEKALDIAQEERISRPFLVDDENLQELLRSHAPMSEGHGDWVTSLAQQGGVQNSGNKNHASLLSDREVEILSYLCTDKTAEEIGAAVHLSANTIRTHQRSIYRKLGVRSRRDAVRAWTQLQH